MKNVGVGQSSWNGSSTDDHYQKRYGVTRLEMQILNGDAWKRVA
jgi:hypothetical protein